MSDATKRDHGGSSTLRRLVKTQLAIGIAAIVVTVLAAIQIASLYAESADLEARNEKLTRDVTAKETKIVELEKQIELHEERARQAQSEAKILSESLSKSREAAEHVRAGINYYQRGEFSKAVKRYQAALEIDPYNHMVYDWMGYSLYRDRKYSEAEAALRRSVELEPSYARGYYNLALVLWRRGEQRDAIDALRAAVQQSSEIIDDLRRDGQFSPFRANPEFRQLVESGGAL